MVDKDTYMEFALGIYNNPGCIDEKEFEYDARRPLRIKFVLRKWKEENREIDARHVINHIMIMNNCFGKYSVRMILLYCKEYLSSILPFFDYLGMTPAYATFGNYTIVLDKIERDEEIVEILKRPL